MSNANISGRRVRQARDRLGWQQVELAAALNVDFEIKLEQSDISEIERGVRAVKDFELDALARVLDVSPVWLLRGDGEQDESIPASKEHQRSEQSPPEVSPTDNAESETRQ